MNEYRIRRMVLDLLRPLAAFPVENPIRPGTPDVCCVEGWIEIKLASFPAQSTSHVRVEVQESQPIWHRRWTHAGGRSFILTVIQHEWFLHSGEWAENLAHVTEQHFRDAALESWSRRPSSKELIRSLSWDSRAQDE